MERSNELILPTLIMAAGSSFHLGSARQQRHFTPRPPEMEKRGATIGYLALWNTVTLLHCYCN